MSAGVLIIDDEERLARNIEAYLRTKGFETRVASTGETGLSEVKSFNPDVVLLDFQLQGANGLEILRRIHDDNPSVKVILITGHGNIELAVEAIKSGAIDFLTKPISLKQLQMVIEKALEEERRNERLAYYEARESDRGRLDSMIGNSPAMQALHGQIRSLLAAERRLLTGPPPAVLVTGESGTGKELVARALHFDGTRTEGPFIEINCATLPGHLVEAELFGFERGAFTDAKERKLGLIEMADKGTLFLDEIGEMDIAAQAKLLKVIEDRNVRRLGGTRDRRVDIRIIAATNQTLEDRISDGRFRADLYYRLSAVHITLPPLRDRGEDAVLLAKHFLAHHGRRYGRTDLEFSDSAREALLHHHWPGNVRELNNRVEQAILMAGNGVIDFGDLRLPGPPSQSAPKTAETDLPGHDLSLDEAQSAMIRKALDRADGNVSQAARLLGISRDTLRYRLEKYGIQPSG